MKDYLLKEKAYIFFILLLGISATISKAYASIIQMKMLDVAINKDFLGIIILLGINGLNWFLFDLLEYLKNVAEKKCILSLNHQVRRKITEKIKKRTYSEFISNTTGEYLSWYTNDVLQMQNLGFEVFFLICTEIISLIVGIIMLLRFHWMLVFAAFIQSGIIALSAKKMKEPLKNKSKNVSRALEIFSEKTKELISAYFTLNNFGHIHKFEENMSKNGDDLEYERFHYEKEISKNNLFVSVFQILGGIFANGTLFCLAIFEMIPFSTIFGGCNLMAMVSNSTNELGRLCLKIASASPYFEKIKGIDGKKNIHTMQKSFSGLEKSIKMENVSFSYGNKKILNNLTLEFEKNKKYALIGKSGSGKSTILKILMGYLDNYNGVIRFDHIDLKCIKNEELWSQIAYIEQDSFLFDDTILNNITLGMEYDDSFLSKVLEDSSLMNDIRKFENGLFTKVGENGNKISGGQKQRIAIARALFHHRSIILMDEGTSALDKKNALDIENSLLLNPDITLILISHNLDDEQKRKFDCVYDLNEYKHKSGANATRYANIC